MVKDFVSVDLPSMKPQSRILVTGGCGYVGSVLVPRLLADGHEVLVVDTCWFGNHLPSSPNLEVLTCDVCEFVEVNDQSVHAVIHLANIANDPGVELNPALSWEVNVLGSQQLIEWSIRNGASQFIYASSGSVYGVSDEPEVTEEVPLVPISVYNKTKMIAERVLLSYGDQIKIHCIRPATVCGFSPRMRLDVSVNLLTKQAFQNKRVTVFGGDQTRPNIHIDDMARVYTHFIENFSLPAGCYNAGFENMTILKIAQLVAEMTGAEIAISESNDPRSYRQNSSKLKATGFTPKFTVADAIADMLERWSDGSLVDSEKWNTVTQMKRLGIGS